MRQALFLVLISLLVIVVTACGTPAEPVPNSQTLEAQAAAEDADTSDDGEDVAIVAEEPTVVPLTATPTSLPPTATPTELPPTPEPTEEVAAEAAPVDQVAQLASLLGDPIQGEALFNTSYTTNLGEWACSTCHNHASAERKIGPGLLGIPQYGSEQVEGQVVQRYIWNSIIAPQEYIVDGYAEGQQMPGNYRDLLSDDELYHLIAYLMTLNE